MKELKPNGRSHEAGTTDDTIRDVVDRLVVKLDENTAKTDEAVQATLHQDARIQALQDTLDDHATNDTLALRIIAEGMAHQQGQIDARGELVQIVLDRLGVPVAAAPRGKRGRKGDRGEPGRNRR